MGFDVDGPLRLWTDPPADDAEAVAAFRAVYTDPVLVNGSRLTAGDLVSRARARALGATLADPRREVLGVVESRATVAVAFRLTGRHAGPFATQLGPLAATGRTLTIRVIDLLTLQGGRIAQIEMVADGGRHAARARRRQAGDPVRGRWWDAGSIRDPGPVTSAQDRPILTAWTPPPRPGP